MKKMDNYQLTIEIIGIVCGQHKDEKGIVCLKQKLGRFDEAWSKMDNQHFKTIDYNNFVNVEEVIPVLEKQHLKYLSLAFQFISSPFDDLPKRLSDFLDTKPTAVEMAKFFGIDNFNKYLN